MKRFSEKQVNGIRNGYELQIAHIKHDLNFMEAAMKAAVNECEKISHRCDSLFRINEILANTIKDLQAGK